MKTSLYLAGEFIDTKEKLDVMNPYNQETIAQCSLAQTEHLNTAIERALEVQDKLEKMPVFERATVLKYIGDSILLYKRRFTELIALESGKPLKYAAVEVERAADTFLIAAEECKRLPKEYLSLDWTPAGKNKEGVVKYFPLGIVAAISPFNFPLNLVAHKLAPAIAAGCPVILKPSSQTPLTALMLAGIIDQTILTKGALSVLPCHRTVGDLLVTDDRIALLSFTGSPEIGWALKAKSGRKKAIMELGGNAGVYIHNDADVDFALQRCVVGGFAFSGQVCIHAQRIYVHKDIAETFIAKYKTAVEQLKFGDPMDKYTDVSVMIDEKNAMRVENWINEGIEQGAQLLTGGKREKTYVAPTLLTNTKNGQKVHDEEVFGPVVCIEPVNDEDEGIARLNATRFGLQAGIFTNNHSLIQNAFNNVKVGGVMVNDVPTFRVDHMPYGGIKDSGMGREGVAYTIKEYMEPRLLVY